MPTPATSRQTSIPSAEDCSAITAAAAEYQMRAATKTRLRPNRSARRETPIVPINSPRKVAATKLAWSGAPNRPTV